MRVDDLFEIRSGNSLTLSKLRSSTVGGGGIPFVSRQTVNNGVAAYVQRIPGIVPNPAGEITCALNGEGGALAAFLQDRPYYTGYHVARLKPLREFSTAELLYYCRCIWENHYKYSWGRQANRTLASVEVPAPTQIPAWVHRVVISGYLGVERPASQEQVELISTNRWKWYTLEQLFDIERGRGPRKKHVNEDGTTPFVTSTDSNNGVVGFTSTPPCHAGNTIGVNRNGSVGEAFYQPRPFCSTEDVHVFIPKFQMNVMSALFLTTLIRQEKYRFGYGRKWGLDRMKKSRIKLPARPDGAPDWKYMETFIGSLAFSSQL